MTNFSRHSIRLVPIEIITYRAKKSFAMDRFSKSSALYFCGFLLLFLGLGNVLFGSIKLREYQTFLYELEATKELSGHENLSAGAEKQPSSALASDPLPPLKSQRTLHKLYNRLQFYKLAVTGGRFLLLSGLMILLYRVWSGKSTKTKSVAVRSGEVTSVGE